MNRHNQRTRYPCCAHSKQITNRIGQKNADHSEQRRYQACKDYPFGRVEAQEIRIQGGVLKIKYAFFANRAQRQPSTLYIAGNIQKYSLVILYYCHI